jgi:hypothetical protein
VLRRFPRAALVACCVAATLPAAAAEDAVPELDWSTFAYDRPAPIYRLRLGLEELGAVGVAYIGYTIQDPPPTLPGVRNPTWIWEKLAFLPGTWVFDADSFGTNMVGHAAAGTAYYMIARGNRTSIPEAFGWTVAASLLWELIEYKEPVSINDAIVTPAGGLALGEAFTQLSSWFDRSGDDVLSKVLAWVFDPAKKLHDCIDGVIPDRDPRSRGWHEFQAAAGGGALWQSATGATYPVGWFGIGSRLLHAPGYGAPGRDRFAFGDGNASRVGLAVTFTGSAVVDFAFDTEVVLAGLYQRDLDGPAERRSGWDFLIGLTSGYEYGYHRWDLASGALDHISLVRLPGLTFRPRLLAGDWAVALDLDAALTFGGVQPFGLSQPATFPIGTAFPPVLLVQGYYFALGLRLAPSLEVRFGPLAAGGAVCLDLLTGLTQPNVVTLPGTMADLSDERLLASAWARWRVPDPPLEAALSFQWRSRSGSANAVSASEHERTVLGRLGIVF